MSITGLRIGINFGYIVENNSNTVGITELVIFCSTSGMEGSTWWLSIRYLEMPANSGVCISYVKSSS